MPSVWAVSKHLQESLLLCCLSWESCSPSPLWVWSSIHSSSLAGKGITTQAAAAVDNIWTVSQKVKHTTTV